MRGSDSIFPEFVTWPRIGVLFLFLWGAAGWYLIVDDQSHLERAEAQREVAAKMTEKINSVAGEACPKQLSVDASALLGLVNVSLHAKRTVRCRAGGCGYVLVSGSDSKRHKASGADVEILRGDCSGEDFENAHLDDADLKDVTLAGADLSEAALHGARLDRAVLRGADLRGADFGPGGPHSGRTSLRNADLEEASLQNAGFYRADLADANLAGARLTDADLTAASLVGTNLEGARLDRALLVHADLTGATLTDVRANDTRWWGARCPDSGRISPRLTTRRSCLEGGG